MPKVSLEALYTFFLVFLRLVRELSRYVDCMVCSLLHSILRRLVKEAAKTFCPAMSKRSAGSLGSSVFPEGAVKGSLIPVFPGGNGYCSRPDYS